MTVHNKMSPTFYIVSGNIFIHIRFNLERAGSMALGPTSGIMLSMSTQLVIAVVGGEAREVASGQPQGSQEGEKAQPSMQLKDAHSFYPYLELLLVLSLL